MHRVWGIRYQNPLLQRQPRAVSARYLTPYIRHINKARSFNLAGPAPGQDDLTSQNKIKRLPRSIRSTRLQGQGGQQGRDLVELGLLYFIFLHIHHPWHPVPICGYAFPTCNMQHATCNKHSHFPNFFFSFNPLQV